MGRAAFSCLTVAGTALFAVAPVAAPAQRTDPAYVRQQRQQSLQEILTTDPLPRVVEARLGCANGTEPSRSATLRNAGGYTRPDPMEFCVAALIRLGREEVLGYVQDAARGTTPAVRFDAGFVTGYLRSEAMPANLPTMAALKPLAERCLGQAEPNAENCYSAGYVLGLRAAHGEVPTAE